MARGARMPRMTRVGRSAGMPAARSRRGASGIDPGSGTDDASGCRRMIASSGRGACRVVFHGIRVLPHAVSGTNAASTTGDCTGAGGCRRAGAHTGRTAGVDRRHSPSAQPGHHERLPRARAGRRASGTLRHAGGRHPDVALADRVLVVPAVALRAHRGGEHAGLLPHLRGTPGMAGAAGLESHRQCRDGSGQHRGEPPAHLRRHRAPGPRQGPHRWADHLRLRARHHERLAVAAPESVAGRRAPGRDRRAVRRPVRRHAVPLRGAQEADGRTQPRCDSAARGHHSRQLPGAHEDCRAAWARTASKPAGHPGRGPLPQSPRMPYQQRVQAAPE